MKRVDLEAKLRALGWIATGEKSGRNHVVWTHVSGRRGSLYVATRKAFFATETVGRLTMMLIGKIFKEGTGWSAHCEVLGVYTQGPTRKEALSNLAEVVEMKVNRTEFRALVTELGTDVDGATSVFVDSTEPALLAAEVLRYQREVHGLSLSDVAKKLGTSSRSAYASYEQGKREPSLSMFRELLGIVAPEIALTVGPRIVATQKRRAKAAR